MRLFTRSSYVGFTATPFANVFIDPDTNEGMLGDDLFPADYIWSLDAPDNYVGPDKVLRQDGGMVVPLLDAEPFFPTGHKSGIWWSPCLPSRCTRRLRTLPDRRRPSGTFAGTPQPHRSMLVNVSQWTRMSERHRSHPRRVVAGTSSAMSATSVRCPRGERSKIRHLWRCALPGRPTSWTQGLAGPTIQVALQRGGRSPSW